MSYKTSIFYRDKFGLRVGATSNTGLIVSNIASKFRKFRDHSLSAKTGFVFLFLFTIQKQRVLTITYKHLPVQLKLQFAAKVRIRNTTSTFLKTSALKVNFEMTNYLELFIFVVFQFIYFLVIKIFNQLCCSLFVMSSNFYHIQ